MDVLVALVFAVGAFAIGIVGNLVASEIYDRAPSLARWLIDRAVARVPRNQRRRYREEWFAHNEEYTGNISRLCNAIGMLLAAHRLSKAPAGWEYRKRWHAFVRLGKDAWNLKYVPAKQSIIFALSAIVIVTLLEAIEASPEFVQLILIPLALYGTALGIYFFTRPVIRSDMKYLLNKGLLALRRKF